MPARRRPAQGRIASSEGWHLDKRVPIALIFALFVQALAIITWANTITINLATVVEDVAELKRDFRVRDDKLDTIQGIASELLHVKDDIKRLDRTVEGLRKRKD